VIFEVVVGEFEAAFAGFFAWRAEVFECSLGVGARGA
jgi:hypothetical protein